MAYEELSDVVTVKLGGIDKKTGKKNPTELEGYFLRTEQRPNKFNKEKPQNLYVFQTPKGEEGVFGQAGLDREMRKATPGRMTLVISTGETLDTGKGNPMKVFKVKQDKTNVVDVSDQVVKPYLEASDESYEESYEEEAPAAEEYRAPAPVAPTQPRLAASAANIQRTKMLLNGKR